jgi:hypothetical protein
VAAWRRAGKFFRLANSVPRKQEEAKYFKKSGGGITQTLAALATLATLNFVKKHF